MISVLVECGFFIYSKEVVFLNMDYGQDIIVLVMFCVICIVLVVEYKEICFFKIVIVEKKGKSEKLIGNGIVVKYYMVQFMSFKSEIFIMDVVFRKFGKEVKWEKIVSIGYCYCYVLGDFLLKIEVEKYFWEVCNKGFFDVMLVCKE